MKKLYVLIIVLCLSLNNNYAQNQDYVSGEILVKLAENEAATSLLTNFRHATFELLEPELISKSLNIWKFSYAPATAEIQNVLDVVFENSAVISVQKNHILTNRATPNDLKYSSQWQYYQSNDKDIDANDAWEITTGGKTADGREIVVAVIDDGCNMKHEDIVDNLWVNKNEIENNDKDDDGNGYVDDYRGWNSDAKHDNITGGSHGTPVAGIIGAKGNNRKGVAGVNWDVKLMIIQGGGREAQAIRAYTYVLDNRKLYNETNGEKGAFIVATNASWGIDGGKADDAPMWCELYDKLGEQGVLNAGATANQNWDIDVKGDLPTSCPSDYLIAVTNTTKSDVLYSVAGYGKRTIDLGAPGQGTYTVSRRSYGGFGGTSGATPHVAGTIALLYSAPSKGFARLAMKDPSKAALKVRKYILDGVDPNSSLKGKTVTGGRLNVNNSLRLLLEDEDLSIDDVKSTFDASVTVYPNPTTTTLNFKTEPYVFVRKAYIYTVSGVLVKSFEKGTLNTIDISDLSNGNYILRYRLSDRETFNHKVISKK